MLLINDSATVDNWLIESVLQVDIDDLIEPESSMHNRRFLIFSSLEDKLARESNTRFDVRYLTMGSSEFDPGIYAPLCFVSSLVFDRNTFPEGSLWRIASSPKDLIENRKKIAKVRIINKFIDRILIL